MDKDFLTSVLDVAVRAFSSIIVLFLITRLMGKKQISQLTFFDYVVGISIGSIAAEMASTDEVPYLHALVGMIIYALFALTVSIITNKSVKARRFFTGKTYLIIDKGKILEQNLNKVHYDVNDLLSEARNSGYFNINDIEYALLETNGKISFMPKADKSPPTLSDLNIKKQEEGLVANLIIDGEIMNGNLKQRGLDDVWLKNELKKQKINNISDVILATVDNNLTLEVFKKTKKEIKKTFID